MAARRLAADTVVVAAGMLALGALRESLRRLAPPAWPLKRRLRTANAVASSLHAFASALDGLWLVHAAGDDPHTAFGGAAASSPTTSRGNGNAALATPGATPAGSPSVGAGRLVRRLQLHMLLELAWYLFDTVDEVIQIRAAAHARRVSVAASSQGVADGGGGGGPSVLQAGFLLHHVPPLGALVSYLAWFDSASAQRGRGIVGYITSMCFLANFSTPFQNFRVLMRDAGMHQSHPILYRANFVTFFASFTLLRLIGLPYLLRSVVWVRGLPTSTSLLEVVTTQMPRKCVAGTVVLAGINWYWWAINARKIVAVLQGRAS